jgi:MjaI restriction endonuclease
MIIKIKNSEINELLIGKEELFPKYSTQLMNLANQNAGGTRPKVVGQMSDLIVEFQGKSVEEWEKWYLNKKPEALENATKKVLAMMQNLKEVILQIDEKMVRRYIKDLLISKTFTGLKFQEAILKVVAKQNNTTYEFSSTYDEAKGIDGYIGDIPVSIKPTTYKTMKYLKEGIYVKFIFYEKIKDGIIIEYEL